MKKILMLLAFVLSTTCFYNFTYASDNQDEIIIKDNKLRLTPYSNFRNEGQISSDEIIVENQKSTEQKVYFQLFNTDGSTIELKDKSVFYNDFGEEKAAFVHFMNMETGEKVLIYNIGEKTDAGVLAPGERAVYKICGELNVNALWEIGDSLSINASIIIEEDFNEDIVTTGESIDVNDSLFYEETNGTDSLNNSEAADKEDSSEENKDNVSVSDVIDNNNDLKAEEGSVDSDGDTDTAGDISNESDNDNENISDISIDMTEDSNDESDGNMEEEADDDSNSRDLDEVSDDMDSDNDFDDSLDSDDFDEGSDDMDSDDGFDDDSDSSDSDDSE